MRELRPDRLPILLVGLVLFASGVGATQDADSDGWRIWERIYANRAEVTVHSARATYLRRLYSPDNPHTRVALETYAVQGDRFLVESFEYEVATDVPLDRVALDQLEPLQSNVYFWDGAETVSMSRQPEETTTVSLHATPFRIPAFADFGRGQQGMPTADAMANALEAMAKKLHVERIRENGRDLVVLEAGLELEPGYFLSVVIEPGLDYAVRRVTTRIDGIVVTDETYAGFELIDGLYVPQTAVRENFRLIGPAESELSVREEFLRIGPASFNRELKADQLMRPVPEGAEVVDMRETPSTESVR